MGAKREELDAEALRIEQRLDQAIASTFPCSDPIAISCLSERAAAKERAAAAEPAPSAHDAASSYPRPSIP